MLSQFNLTPLELENAERYLDKFAKNRNMDKCDAIRTAMFRNYIEYLKECTKNGTIRSCKD